MENPQTWGDAEKIVSGVLRDHDARPPLTVGLSQTRRICDALRDAGMLLEMPEGMSESDRGMSHYYDEGTHVYDRSYFDHARLGVEVDNADMELVNAERLGYALIYMARNHYNRGVLDE